MTPIDILLVEDSPGDIELVKEAMKEGKLSNTLNVVTDGQEAIDYLFKKNDFRNVNSPDLVLLDLNLPKISGLEVLERIKTDAKLKTLPVVVLTTSSHEEDVLNAYSHMANSFVTKPIELDAFMQAIISIEDYWVSFVKLPTSE